MLSSRFIVGAMSGTSADGVDIAVTRISGHGLKMSAKLIHHHAQRYPGELRERIFTLRDTGQTSLSELNNLGRDITMQYAIAIHKALIGAHLQSSDITAIAAHGQTLYHAPPLTMQWFDPTLLAWEVGCDVVSDFRRADCAAGGQGAPLVPFADYIMFRHPEKNRILLNIGGIANLTFVPAGALIDSLVAFDTGPGNCISDYLCRLHNPEGPGYDVAGSCARRGKGDSEIAGQFLTSAYFLQPPPKSTDGPAMIAAFKHAVAASGIHSTSMDDQLATACLCTIGGILLVCDKFLQSKGPVHEIIVSGGGTANQCMMDHLQEYATRIGAALICTTEMSLPSEAKEAVAFALLGAANLGLEPANVPSVTGASRRVVLGTVTPKP